MSTAPDMALVIAGHGSRDPEGVKQFEAFIEGLRQARPNQLIRHGYLEFARPTIDEAARACVAAGAKRIAVVPGVLLGATHAKNDMPVEVMMLQKEFPGNEFQYGAPLHLHPRVLDACRDRVLETEASSLSSIPRSATCLVIAGRGTTDPDANSDVAKLARILQEGMGFAHSAVCFSGTATPLMPEGLQAVAKTGVRRIIILPFFLFTGVLMKRIATACAETAAAFPKSEFLLCEPLGAHPALLDAFTDRAKEALEGSARSNCGLCKYRTAIVGYEAEAGTPQQAHHGHVRATPLTPDASNQGTFIPPPQAATPSASTAARSPKPAPWEPHPIEAESMEIIRNARDWSTFPPSHLPILQRLVHTTGNVACADSIYISPGAIEAGFRAIKDRCTLLCDVTMVSSGLRRTLVEALGLRAVSLVHDEETRLVAEVNGITRSAAGIRRGWMKFGDQSVVLIGDAPTALEETLRLIRAGEWRPRLVVGLPVGFVGTEASKDALRKCLHVPRITNQGTTGGSPWAAATMNALMIQLAKETAASTSQPNAPTEKALIH
jgi:precorrin-8X/cobalt-precorrin-8 methylmutase